MANIKFSQFTTQTDPANVQFVVGYNGTTNVKIAPGDIGGGGATSLNGLTDCLVDTNSLYVGEVPAGLSGNPQDNTVLGIDAGGGLTTGQRNTFIGNVAGLGTTTGNSIVAIGHDSSLGTNSNSNSVTIGVNSNRGGGSANAVIIGDGAAYNGNASNAVVIGQAAGNSTAGSQVTLIGNFAGAFGGSATGQIAIGAGQTGRSNTADYHMDVGYAAGYSNTSGVKNINIGYYAGYSNTTSQNRTIVGYEAGYFSTGSYNTFLGYRVAYGSSGNTTGERNVAIGDVALTALQGGGRNVSIGTNSGQAITSGGENVIIGDFAGSTLTTGADNIIIGQNAQSSSATVSNEITLGAANITLLRIPGLGSTDGHVLQYSSSSGGIVLAAAGGGGASDLNGLSDCLVTAQESQFIGNVPASVSATAYYNTSLGYNALEAITDGDSNVGIGWQAAKTVTSGIGNVAVGTSALQNSNTSNVVAIGNQAAYSATSSNSIHISYESARVNTAASHISIGYQSGYSNTSGFGNTNLGYRAGYSNTTGGDSVNIGYDAGYTATGSQNTTVGRGAFGGGFGHNGIGNVAFGYLALQSPSGSSNYNIAIGSEALKGAGTKSNNVAVGYKAGTAVTTGSNNVAIGHQALLVQTDGEKNVAIGAGALMASTSEGRNTAVGFEAMKAMNQLFNPSNTAVGYQADATATDSFYRTSIGASTGGNSTGSNITNIGYNAQESSSTVSNEITLGNSSVATLRCAVTSITSLSDERDKTEIKDLGYGLAFIDALQPREFVWDNRAETNADGEEFYSSNKGKKDFGFIAQEVKELDNDTLRLVYDENPDKLELSYGKLVPVLVQAIKELKEEIELLKQ